MVHSLSTFGYSSWIAAEKSGNDERTYTLKFAGRIQTNVCEL